MNAKLRALLLPILRTVRSGKAPSFRNRSAAEQAIFLLGKPASQRRKKAAAARKSAKASQHQDSTASIRDAVFQRAAGKCEGTGGHSAAKNCSGSLQLDHWLSGSGRRREKQALENTWLLCSWHHRRRTANLPCAAEWNDRFEEHCRHYGYPFVPHIVHEQMTSAASAPQAPAKALSGDES